ncbi:hypothetical protein MtrunA17_Chr6g0462201 [Medicago truncatula]|uniref:Uncharacterized protein n=1 Tax=Medicago truncatula TaxID=3880 RepID=A0A396HIZ0_MEDTR|nr:hypothetical protein MtrunA17_Chr6g0462201 [Medicago truncatula]
MRREDLTKKDSMSNSTGRITRSKSNSSQKFNSLSVGSSSREREDKEDGPSHKINYVDGLVDKNPSCLVSTRLTTVNPNVRKNPDFTKQLGFDDGEKRNRGEISCPDLKEGSQGMSPDKEPLALSEPLKLLDDDTHEVPEDSFSEPVIDNGLLNHTYNNVTNFNVGFPFGAPTDKVNVDSENQAPNTVSWGQNGDLVRPTLLSNGKVTSFSTNFNNFKNSTEGFTNDAEHSCSQHKRRKLEKLVDFMGQRPASGTSSIKEDNLEAVIGVQRSAFDQADDTRQARMPADAMVDAREIQEKEGPSWKVRKEEVNLCCFHSKNILIDVF